MAHSPDYIVDYRNDPNGLNYRVLRDQLGSPLLIVNATTDGTLMEEYTYDATAIG